MSDTVFCPFCSATTGAQIPLPVTITPIKGGVHVESYRPCPECGRTVCYDQVEEVEPKTEVVGFDVEWHYNDGERAYHGHQCFGADEYDKAAAFAKKKEDPDTVVYLWPIEEEVRE